MITTMATWTLICTLSMPMYLPRKQMQERIPNPQECETLASNCWRDYYANQQKVDTSFETRCSAQANHREYFFSYTCDKALSCHRV